MLGKTVRSKLILISFHKNTWGFQSGYLGHIYKFISNVGFHSVK